MTQPAPVLLEVRDHVAEIRLNRPAVLNAIDPTTAAAFEQAAASAVADDSVRVVLLCGEGRAFAAGGDLAFMREAPDRAAAVHSLFGPIHAALERLAASPKPVLGALQGPVAGAGMSLALATDLAIAADDMVMNMAYINVGAPPDCGGTWALPRLVGLRKAMEIVLLSDRIPAAEALRLGLVNRVVPRDQLAQEARALALRLAAQAPLAMGHVKRLLRSSLERTLPAQLAQEGEAFAANAASEDFLEAVNAFFGKRAPVFRGR